MRTARVVKWTAVGVVGALILLALVGYLLTFTGVYQTWARGLILRTIEDRLRAQATIGRVSGNLLYRANVENLVLTREGQPLLRARQLSLTYFLPQVVLATPVVGATVQGFDLSVVRDAQGRLNISDLVKPRPPTGRNVVVSGVTLERGRVSYSAPGAAPKVVEDINIRAGVGLPASPDQPLVIRIRSGSFRLNQPAVAVRTLTGTVSHGPRLTSVDLQARVETPQGSVEAKVAGTGGGATLAAAQASGHADVSRLQLTSPTVPQGQGAFDYQLAGDTLTLTNGRFTTPAAEATFAGRVPGVSRVSTGRLDAAFQGRLEARDLARLTGRATLSGTLAANYTLKVSRRANQPLSIDLTATGGRATIAGYDLDSESLSAAYRSPVLDITSLKAVSRRLGTLSVSGPYEPGRSLDLAFQAQTADVGGLASRLGAKKIVTGSLNASGQVTGAPRSPEVRGAFTGRGLGWGDVSAAQARGSFEATDILGQRRGQVSATLTGAVAKGRSFSRASVTITLPREGALSFSGQASQPEGVTYQAKGSATGLGQPRSTISLTSFAAQAGRLRLVNTRPLAIVSSAQGLSLPQVALRSTDGTMAATGSAAVPGAVKVLLTFNNANLTDISRLIRLNFPLRGQLTGRIDIGGSTDRPDIMANLNIGEGAVSQVPFSKLAANLNYAPQLARVDARLTLPGGREAAVRGTVPAKVTLLPPAVEVASGQALLQGLGQQAVPGLFERLFKGLKR